MVKTQLGISMVKANQRPAGFRGSNVHLPTPGGFVARDQTNCATTVQLVKRLSGLYRDHDPLGKFRADLQTVYQIDDEIIIIPDGNNEADQWMLRLVLQELQSFFFFVLQH